MQSGAGVINIFIFIRTKLSNEKNSNVSPDSIIGKFHRVTSSLNITKYLLTLMTTIPFRTLLTGLQIYKFGFHSAPLFTNL